jgi:nucleotide-binding universal stress UspA family protein
MSENEEIKRILVAVDGSPQSIKAVKVAAKVAKGTGAEMTIIHVNEMNDLPTLMTEGEHPEEESKGHMVLSDAVEIAESEGINANGIIKHGHAAGQILVFANEYSPQLLFMGTRGLGRAMAMVMGSVSQVVVHGAKTSVVVVK